MLDKKDFLEIRKKLGLIEEKREESIQKSREIIKVSKEIIYALHRNDIKNAEEEIKKIKSLLSKLPPRASGTSMNSVAQQEYVEAMCFYGFVKQQKIPTGAQLKVNTEEYLMGLCDLTGELVRKAVNEAIKQNYKMVYDIKELVEEIYGEFLHFNLRNSELRKKSDSIKWNLNKLEDLMLSIKLRK